VEGVNGVEKEQRPHALIEITAGSPETIEFATFGEQGVQSGARADGI
jgi:hypothetical protein